MYNDVFDTFYAGRYTLRVFSRFQPHGYTAYFLPRSKMGLKSLAYSFLCLDKYQHCALFSFKQFPGFLWSLLTVIRKAWTTSGSTLESSAGFVCLSFAQSSSAPRRINTALVSSLPAIPEFLPQWTLEPEGDSCVRAIFLAYNRVSETRVKIPLVQIATADDSAVDAVQPMRTGWSIASRTTADRALMVERGLTIAVTSTLTACLKYTKVKGLHTQDKHRIS